MYTSLPESPQGVGDIIGLAFRIVRRNIGTIFRFILVPSLFTVLAGIVFQWVFTYGTAAISESKNFAAALGLAGACFVAMILGAIAWWVLGLRLLALTRVVLGFSPSLEEASQYMSRRKFGLVGLYLLYLVLFSAAMVCWFVITFLGIFVGSVGGAGTGIDALKAVVVALFSVFGISGMVMTAAFYIFASTLSYCILACENLPVSSVIGRSLQFSGKYFWRALAFALVFSIAFSIISYPLSLPVAVIAFIDALQHGLASAGEGVGAAYKPPLYILVLTQAWEAAMGFILRPLVFFAFGLFYYDLRLRNEGLDLQRKLELIEAPAKT